MSAELVPTLNEQKITSPLGHEVWRTAFRATPEAPARTHWLHARRKLITSTDVPAILGFDKNRSAYSVYVDKTTAPDPDAPDLAETNEAVKWGQLLEDIVAEEAARVMKRQFIDHGRHTIFWTRDVIPGVPIGTSLDREIQALPPVCAECGQESDRHDKGDLDPATGARWLICCGHDGKPVLGRSLTTFRKAPDPRGPGVYEGKTSGEFSHGEDWEVTEEDEVGAPLRAQTQVQTSLAVLGWQWGVIGGLLGGFSFSLKLRDLERDPDFLPFARPRLQEFWKRVEQRDPPPADGSASTFEALKRQYPSDSGFEIALPEIASVWDAELVDAKARAKQAKADAELYRNKFLAAIGEARVAVLPDGSRYSLARTKDPKPTCCPSCAAVVSQKKAARPLRRLADED